MVYKRLFVSGAVAAQLRGCNQQPIGAIAHIRQQIKQSGFLAARINQTFYLV
ncbi:hypothetical protein H6G72_18160 [Planktothricoides sp. FACHB-1370]|uniref:Uncharacterized protein n=1 Tax=Planktothricoides raciborskii FACHB-1370 TaxID=2949576 RepID=A0ABR8EGK3_9CYAN|nr:hypothetical protein [Planktothricoides sp. SR001]MBD2545725.1 hypothetical protein [Planktothricoides raciborskii FACHB-1370]MBD2582703.1 hypothetical protein [Planktothricoides raciborskii FACHB-1261]